MRNHTIVPYLHTVGPFRLAGRTSPDLVNVCERSEWLIRANSNLRKIKILLQALDDSGKEIDYYALDISLPELDRTLSAIPSGTFSHVRCRGLYGTYDDGLEWLRRSCRSKPSVVLWMGSSLGNLEHPDAATFLSQFASILQPSDALLVAVDGCLEKDQVFSAYNDREGVTQAFYRNGLDHANRVLGYELFKQRDWDVVGEFDEEHWRHNAFISPKQDIKAHGFTFKKGERVRLENSYKFSEAARLSLWSESGLALRASYADKRNQYCECDARPALLFHLLGLIHATLEKSFSAAVAVRPQDQNHGSGTGELVLELNRWLLNHHAFFPQRQTALSSF